MSEDNYEMLVQEEDWILKKLHTCEGVVAAPCHT